MSHKKNSSAYIDFQRWPFILEPFFHIEICRKCHDHRFCTRHDEGVYKWMANDLKTKIEYLIPELDPVRNIHLSPNDTPI